MYVIHQSNKGISKVRDAGLNHATGEFISFIDGNDHIHPQIFEISYVALQKRDSDFSMILYKEFYNMEQIQFISNYSSRKIYQNQLKYDLYNSSNKHNSYLEINFYVM